jgi:hypothetical protein
VFRRHPILLAKLKTVKAEIGKGCPFIFSGIEFDRRRGMFAGNVTASLMPAFFCVASACELH